MEIIIKYNEDNQCVVEELNVTCPTQVFTNGSCVALGINIDVKQRPRKTNFKNTGLWKDYTKY